MASPHSAFVCCFFGFQSVEERCVYQINPENGSWTEIKREAWISSKVYGLTRAIQVSRVMPRAPAFSHTGVWKPDWACLSFSDRTTHTEYKHDCSSHAVYKEEECLPGPGILLFSMSGNSDTIVLFYFVLWVDLILICHRKHCETRICWFVLLSMYSAAIFSQSSKFSIRIRTFWWWWWCIISGLWTPDTWISAASVTDLMFILYCWDLCCALLL